MMKNPGYLKVYAVGDKISDIQVGDMVHVTRGGFAIQVDVDGEEQEFHVVDEYDVIGKKLIKPKAEA